jgi:putative ABC transport system ATP-binding protein
MSALCLEQVRRVFVSRSDHGAARAVLDGVSLTIEPGEVVALIGRSGAGKTTLLYLAAGLARPDAGRVLLGGRDLATMGAAELSRLRRREIGLVFQNNLALSALPVWENAALPLLLEGVSFSEARRRAVAALERVGLDACANEPTAMLSGGQRRRLGLSRAMVGSPRLLLADEPTADLDEETAGEVERLLAEWLAEQHCAALIVTHTASIEHLAARTLRLENGALRPAGAIVGHKA